MHESAWTASANAATRAMLDRMLEITRQCWPINETTPVSHSGMRVRVLALAAESPFQHHLPCVMRLFFYFFFFFM